MAKVPTLDRENIPFNPETVKEFIERLFAVERELKTLSEDRKYLMDEYKGRIDLKLIKNIISLVKLEVKMSESNASEQTIAEIGNIVKDKVAMIIGE